MNTAELIAGYDILDRYMARRAQKSKSPELFGDDGNARWITIGGQPGADGKKHGGHPVKVSGDGTMLSGKFAVKTLDEAFGRNATKPDDDVDLTGYPPINPGWKGTKAEFKAHIDNLRSHDKKRMADKLGAAVTDVTPPGYGPSEPESKPSQPEPPKAEPKQPDQPPSDGIARVSADQLGDGSDGTYDQMHAGLASEFVQSRIAKGMEGIDGREYGIFQHSSGKWQMVSRKKQAAKPIEKPVEKPAAIDSKPASDPNPASASVYTPEPKSAASLFGEEINSGGTPREAAKAAQKKLDEDYIYARASEIGNAGEDLKGSARHKVNAWRGLEQAEKDGNADKLVTRDSLMKLEPTNFVAQAQNKPLLSLTMHFAIKSFPPKPGNRNGTPEKNRREYLEAYRDIKAKAEELVEKYSDTEALGAMSELRTFVSNKINQLRSQKIDDPKAMVPVSDRYNQTANDLINFTNGLSPYSSNKTSVGGRFNEFGKEVERKYGVSIHTANKGDIETKRAYWANLTKHAQDIIEGASMNDTFGKESDKRTVRRFNPSEAYVSYAKREGGRDVSKIVADPNKAVKHMVDELQIRGVQWGNSVTDDERKHHAGKVVEAITDLADVVGLHPKDFSLGGKLGLAIGARGKGNASAHYEPGSKVINLTRASGVGALAHEWGHAFDHMLEDFKTGLKSSSYMSENSEFTHEIVNDSTGRTFDAHSGAKPYEGYSIREKQRSNIRNAFNSWKEACKPYRDRLRTVLQQEVRNGTMSHAKAQDYWASGREVFARTFERHVKHKLEEDGRQNTYLSGLGGDHPLWPNAEEAKAIAPAFDAIFEAFRQEKYGSPEKVKFSRIAAMQELMAFWGFGPHLEQYARKSPKSSPGQMSFDDLDGGRWITIGSESGADGGKHGGHHVYIGKDGEMKTGKFAGQKLSEAFGGGKSTEETRTPKPVHEMSQEELEGHINSQKGDSLTHSWVEDWGNSMRGQGKRVKGMVRGAMSAVPTGKKTYTSLVGKLEGEERREAGLLETHEQHAYVKAREAGIPHEHAMTWAWEHTGDPDFKGLTLKNLKKALGSEKTEVVEPNGGVDEASIKAMAPGAIKRGARELQAKDEGIKSAEESRLFNENFSKIVADDPSKIRKQDVYRLLSEVPENRAGNFESWLIKQRPDLAQEVNEVSTEILEERASKKLPQSDSESSGNPSSLSIDPDQLRGNNFKFADEPVEREINNRRLAASKRRLKLERDAAPLISDQIAELQPTPEQRVKDMDKSAQERFKHFDEQAKATREKAIKGISELSPEDQQRFMAYWNNSPVPSDPAYLATALAKFKSGKVNTQAIVDRSDIEDPEKRKRVEKLDKQKMTMQNIFDNATAVEGKRYAKERIDQIQSELDKELASDGGDAELGKPKPQPTFAQPKVGEDAADARARNTNRQSPHKEGDRVEWEGKHGTIVGPASGDIIGTDHTVKFDDGSTEEVGHDEIKAVDQSASGDRDKAIQHALGIIDKTGHVQTGAQAEQQGYTAWANMPERFRKQFSGYKEFGSAVGKAFHERSKVTPKKLSPQDDLKARLSKMDVSQGLSVNDIEDLRRQMWGQHGIDTPKPVEIRQAAERLRQSVDVSKASSPTAKQPSKEESENLSEDEKSWQESADNFNEVTGNPKDARSRSLHRAISYANSIKNSYNRKLQRGEISKDQRDDMHRSLDAEIGMFGSILKDRGDYASSGPYSDESGFDSAGIAIPKGSSKKNDQRAPSDPGNTSKPDSPKSDTGQEASSSASTINLSLVSPSLRDFASKHPEKWKEYSSGDEHGNPHNPYVAFKFDNGVVYRPISQFEVAKARAKKRGLGNLVGIKPIDPDMSEMIHASPFDFESMSENHPRRIKFEHRMKLKEMLPKKNSNLVTFAKRSTKAEFLSKYGDEHKSIIKNSTGLDVGEFWKQVNNGPGKSGNVEDKSSDLRETQSDQPSSGIAFDTRTNSDAKPDDQMGLFGDVSNVPRGKAKLPPGGESKGKQLSMFDTKGDPDQMLMFDDGVTPEDRLMKFGNNPEDPPSKIVKDRMEKGGGAGQYSSIRDRAAELIQYWGLSTERLGELFRYAGKSQLMFDWDESKHPRETEKHDGKLPGQFAPKHAALGSAHDEWSSRRHKVVGDHPTSFLTGHSSEPVRNEARKNPGIGLLITPNTPQYVRHITDYSHIAIDNGVYSEFAGSAPFDEDKFRKLLDKVAKDPESKAKVKFVVAPDVVGDWRQTVKRSKPWLKEIRDRGFPVAWVAQDGIEKNTDQIPWDDFDVLFIGGSTAWKLGFNPIDGNPLRPTDNELQKSGVNYDHARLIKEAKKRGKKLHIGRVNSWKRAEMASYGVQAHTMDGNFIGAAPDQNLPKVRSWLESITHNMEKPTREVDVDRYSATWDESKHPRDELGQFAEVGHSFSNEASAIGQYRKAYTAGWKVGPVTTMTINQFKVWLKDGSQNKGIEGQVSKYSFREEDHPRDGDGKFTKVFRIHSKEFTQQDLHDAHESKPWVDSGDERLDRPRKGLSASKSIEDLVDYFAGGNGVSIGRGALFNGSHFVELEGEESGDDPWEKESEILIHPKKIISSTPIEKHDFFRLLKEKINSRFEHQIDDPATQEFDWSSRLNNWIVKDKKTGLSVEALNFLVDDSDDLPEVSELKAEAARILQFWKENPSRIDNRLVDELREFSA